MNWITRERPKVDRPVCADDRERSERELPDSAVLSASRHQAVTQGL